MDIAERTQSIETLPVELNAWWQAAGVPLARAAVAAAFIFAL